MHLHTLLLQNIPLMTRRKKGGGAKHGVHDDFGVIVLPTCHIHIRSLIVYCVLFFITAINDFLESEKSGQNRTITKFMQPGYGKGK